MYELFQATILFLLTSEVLSLQNTVISPIVTPNNVLPEDLDRLLMTGEDDRLLATLLRSQIGDFRPCKSGDFGGACTDFLQVEIPPQPIKGWTQGYVPCSISTAFNADQRNVILQGIEAWNSQVECIKFKERTSETDYVFILPGTGCQSNVEVVGGPHPVFLCFECDCMRTNTVLHELGHAVGLPHEHMRPNRDNYVEIVWENLPQGQESNYQKIENDLYPHIEYDYYSMMHYPVEQRGKQVFLIKDMTVDQSKIGNAESFTALDLMKIEYVNCNLGPI